MFLSFEGELNGRHGFVPCNMVSELQYDPETGQSISAMKQQQFSAQDPWSHLQVRRMVALYDYDPLGKKSTIFFLNLKLIINLFIFCRIIT